MHDTNLVPLLSFLNYPITYIPKYNANVRFELLKSEGEFYVRIKFDQETIKVCKKNLCTFDEFENVIQQNIRTQCNDFKINYNYLENVGIN